MILRGPLLIFSATIIGIYSLIRCDASNSVIKTDSIANQSKTSEVPVHLFKDKKGLLLGEVYIKYKAKGIFEQMIILKNRTQSKDTLYSIKGTVFRNPNGVDIEVGKSNFWGYKIVLKRNDYIIVTKVNNKNVGISDNIMISWDYNRKLFEVLKTP